MALNSDAQGFLTGSPVELGALFDELRALRREVQAIARAIRDRADSDSDGPLVVAPKLAVGLSEAATMPAGSADVSGMAAPAPVQPSSRARRIADVAPVGARIAAPSRSPRPVTAEPAPSARAKDDAPAERAAERDDDYHWRSGPTVTGRVANATAEVAKSVVNEEADVSVKAFNEVAEPLKRGWNALRGDASERREKRQEGWLKRIFGALKGDSTVRAGNAAGGSSEGGESRFDTARARAAAGAEVGGDYATARTGHAGGAHGVPVADAGHRSVGRELSLRSIEGYLKSIDRKVQKPKGDHVLLGLVVGVVRLIPALIQWFREKRMDANLDKIEDYTGEQLEVSRPFFAYARKRLKEMGEAEEAGQKRGGGLFAKLIAATLGVLFAKLAGLLSGIPALGAALAGIARMLGGTVPAVMPRRGSAASRAPLPVGAAAAVAAPKWGKTGEGIRGNRAARVGRVAMRNAGRALRPVTAVLRRVPVLGSLLAVGAGVLGARAIAKDDTLTREQKNGAQGRNWGGVGGALGGALGGAALGTMIAGPIGTVVGGVLGAVLGEWLGGDLGQMMGEKFSAFMAPIAAGFHEVKLWGLAAFDWVRDGATAFYDGTKSVFTGVGEWISTRWSELADTVGGLFDTFANMLTTVLNGLKNVPVLGGAIRAAEAAARKAAEVTAGLARSAANVATDTARDVAAGAANLAGRAWDGTKEGLRALVPAGIRDRVAHERALETAADYRAGNIGGLDDAHTRELVASTAMTESAGGKLDMVNSAGYVGRYQAGAGWLADAGHIKGGASAVQAAMRADGFTNEYKWGQSGGMTRFLRNDANWNGGMTLQKYMASADVQDAAFKVNSDAAYNQLVKGGQITSASTPEQIAGLLKARHIAGIGGARTVAAGGTGRADANGTSARDYYNDLAGSNARFAGVFDRSVPAITSDAQRVVAAPTAPVAATLKAPAPPPPSLAPAVPDAPQVQVPLGSGPAAKPVVVQMQQPDAGQDVRDRGIAHIATGGYSRA